MGNCCATSNIKSEHGASATLNLCCTAYSSSYDSQKKAGLAFTKISKIVNKCAKQKVLASLKEVKYANLSNFTHWSELLVSENEKVRKIEEGHGHFVLSAMSLAQNMEFIETRKILNQMDDTQYIGEWNPLKNSKEGYGVQLWPDGSKYFKKIVTYCVDMKVNGKIICITEKDDILIQMAIFMKAIG